MRAALFVTALATSSLLACSGGAPTVPPSQPHALLDQTPEEMRSASLDGDLVGFPQKGKVTLVDFWATSCKPCVKMMPAIEALHQEKKGQGLRVIGVATDDNPGLVMERLKSLGVSYPNVLDDAGSRMRGNYRVDELPVTFVFDRTGKVRLVTKGGDPSEVETLRQAVDALLAEP